MDYLLMITNHPKGSKVGGFGAMAHLNNTWIFLYLDFSKYQ